MDIILVNAKYPGNVGSVARAMKNFGFSKLVLVDSCPITEESRVMAVHAQDVLDKAKVVESLDDLKYNLLIGTTAKSSESDTKFLRLAFTPDKLKERVKKVKGKIGLVFGSEDYGLLNEQLEKCDLTVTIPTSSKYRAMNLSHSVAIILYELSKFEMRPEVRLANQKEKQILFENMEEISKKAGYPADKRKQFSIIFRRIVGRASITGREINTFIGVLKEVKRRIKV